MDLASPAVSGTSVYANGLRDNTDKNTATYVHCIHTRRRELMYVYIISI